MHRPPAVGTERWINHPDVWRSAMYTDTEEGSWQSRGEKNTRGDISRCIAIHVPAGNAAVIRSLLI